MRRGLFGSSTIVCRPMPAGAGHATWSPWAAAQAGQLVPGLAAVGGAEQRGVLHAGVDGVGVGQRRLQVPDALELPGVLRAVVPLVRRERLAGFRRRVVDELVALALGHAVRRRGRFAGRRPRLMPRLAAVVGALDDLPEPAARLRRVDPVGVDGRAFHVVNLPAPEEGAADVPLLALAVRRQDERALPRAHQDPYSAHRFLLAESTGMFAGRKFARTCNRNARGDQAQQEREAARRRAARRRSAGEGSPAGRRRAARQYFNGE